MIDTINEAGADIKPEHTRAELGLAGEGAFLLLLGCVLF